MSVAIAISSYGDPYTIKEIKQYLQEEISLINKDLFIEYLEEEEIDLTEENLFDYCILYEFKDWFLEWKIEQKSDEVHGLNFFYVEENGEISEIDPFEEELFPSEIFRWEFPWIPKE